jgi:hypothetical protein
MTHACLAPAGADPQTCAVPLMAPLGVLPSYCTRFFGHPTLVSHVCRHTAAPGSFPAAGGARRLRVRACFHADGMPSGPSTSARRSAAGPADASHASPRSIRASLSRLYNDVGLALDPRLWRVRIGRRTRHGFRAAYGAIAGACDHGGVVCLVCEVLGGVSLPFPADCVTPTTTSPVFGPCRWHAHGFTSQETGCSARMRCTNSPECRL